MSDISLFGSDGSDTDTHDISVNERRADNQWQYTVVLRQGLSIAYKRPVPYPEVLAAADKYANDILGRQVLLFQPNESKAARYYREKAALLTAKLQRELQSTDRNVRPIELLDQEINEQEELLKTAHGLYSTQREKLEELYQIRKEFTDQNLIYSRESEVLRHEWDRGIDLPTFFAQPTRNHRDFALPNERVMRIWFTHETKTEDIAGVDLIYEYHLPKEKKARLVTMQYKLPKGDDKNIIIDPKIQNQLNRMCAVFCDNDLCVEPSSDEPGTNRAYTFPPCCAFFRPTDRLQQANSRLATAGYHIRRCDIDRVCEYTQKEGNKVITPEISRQHGISFTLFEELFNTGRLGSRWLTYEQLQKFHEHYELVKPYEQAGIYIQEAPQPEPATLF